MTVTVLLSPGLADFALVAPAFFTVTFFLDDRAAAVDVDAFFLDDDFVVLVGGATPLGSSFPRELLLLLDNLMDSLLLLLVVVDLGDVPDVAVVVVIDGSPNASSGSAVRPSSFE